VFAVTTVLAHKELAIVWSVIGTYVSTDRTGLACIMRIEKEAKQLNCFGGV
jgi:hypothetical protein